MTETSSYWFTDHAHRTVFWLHPVDTDAVGLSDSHSSHSKRQLVRCVKLVWSEYSLGENYLAHVEMFPPTASQYSASCAAALNLN